MIGNRILVLSPHPGQVKAELNASGTAMTAAARLSRCRTASTTCCSPSSIEESGERLTADGTAPASYRGRNSSARRLDAEQYRRWSQRPLSAWERIVNITAVRKRLILVLLAADLAGSMRAGSTTRCCSRPSATRSRRLWDAMMQRRAAGARWSSIKVLLMGYAVGIVLAAVLTTLRRLDPHRHGLLLDTLTAMFNPLPAIALLPLALIWFGLGNGSLDLRADPFGAVAGRAQHAFAAFWRSAIRCGWPGRTTA